MIFRFILIKLYWRHKFIVISRAIKHKFVMFYLRSRIVYLNGIVCVKKNKKVKQ